MSWRARCDGDAQPSTPCLLRTTSHERTARQRKGRRRQQERTDHVFAGLSVRIAFGAMSLVVAVSSACKREERRFREIPPTASALTAVTRSPLQPGAGVVTMAVKHPYEDNAWAVAQGKRLFSWMNCVGCHANGGGGMGPPLMDEEWIYGGEPENIFATIVEGRPNGMPAFRGKLSNDQVWQIVAYVRALGGLQRADVRPGRADHMSAPPVEQGLEKARPRRSFVPPASERP
jgi:cytochrome c oxidase cbb3-type subunit 3